MSAVSFLTLEEPGAPIPFMATSLIGSMRAVRGTIANLAIRNTITSLLHALKHTSTRRDGTELHVAAIGAVCRIGYKGSIIDTCFIPWIESFVVGSIPTGRHCVIGGKLSLQRTCQKLL
jgi:hypothetical protein